MLKSLLFFSREMFQVPGKETRLWRISSASVIYAIAATSKLVIGKNLLPIFCFKNHITSIV